MHIFQPKHTKLKPSEVQDLLNKYNISLSQLPRIRLDDPAISKDCEVGDIIKIERKNEEKAETFFRVVV